MAASSHKVFASLLMALALLFALVACSSGSSSGKQLTPDERFGAQNPTLEANEADMPRIICWGDSLTSGWGSNKAIIETDDVTYNASFKSYPEILSDLTGMPTSNYGYPGATSEEIVLRYVTGNVWHIGMPLNALQRNPMAESIAHKEDVLVIEMGSNGGWDDDYDKLIEQYHTILDYSDCESFIIIGDTDDPGTSDGDSTQWELAYGMGLEETQWEQALHDEFGDHFLNMRVYLIEHGLEVTGLEETYDDIENAKMGCVSEQLRTDWTHLNSYGYYAQAMGVYERGKELGYW